MKDSLKYKLFVTFGLLFITLLSLSFGFFVGSSRTDGNVAYWIFKSIAILYLVVIIVLVWLKNNKVGKLLPLSLIGFVIQLIPILLRVGWTGETPKVPVALIYIAAIVMFILVSFSMLLSISSNKFSKDEDRAKPSSNSL